MDGSGGRRRRRGEMRALQYNVASTYSTVQPV